MSRVTHTVTPRRGESASEPLLAPITPEAEAGLRVVLDAALRGREWYQGIEDTPRRAVKALMEMTSGYDVDIDGLFTTFESDGYDEMVVQRDIPFVRLCEHHMLPFTGKVHIGYIANGRIVGLSKMVRLADAYARRFQVQERLTVQIADSMEAHLDPVGVIVVAEAEHSCMSCRGVRRSGSTAVTSTVRGLLKEDAAARAEAFSLIGLR